jgi:hypothetical protein
MDLYRGDSRSPNVIRAAGGFKAWVPLTVQQSQNFVLKFCGSNAQLQLPPSAALTLSKLSIPGFPLNPGDLSRLIISQKSRDTVHISTALDEGCGGYASLGYVYKMKIENLRFTKITNLVLVKPQDLLNKKFGTGFWPELALDTFKLESSSAIAIKQRGDAKELSFLTSIALANIVAYKQSGPAPFIPFHHR